MDSDINAHPVFPKTEELSGSAGTPSVIDRAFDILKAFSPTTRLLTLTEVARSTGLPSSTAHRMLAMLVRVGAVIREGDRYRIGISMFALGALSMDSRRFDIAFPYLEKLLRFGRRTVHLATMQVTRAVCIDKLIGPGSPETPARIGEEFPVTHSALGKAMLSVYDPNQTILDRREYDGLTTALEGVEPLGEYLNRVRRERFAVEREEATAGLSCVASALVVRGTPIGAISVAMHADDPEFHRFVDPVRRTASAISQAIAAKAPAAEF